MRLVSSCRIVELLNRSVALLGCAALLAASAVAGDESSAPLTAVPESPPAAAVDDTQPPLTIADSGLSADPAVQAPGFWIVSTHCSPQRISEGMPRFCPAVTRFEQCQGFRHTDFAELCRSLQPGIPVCIMVHGSFVGWNDVVYESQGTWKWLQTASAGRPLQMIYMTWPSDRPLATSVIQVDVNLLGRQAGRNGYYLADLIRYIPYESPICLIGHSHGTRIISSALHLMAGGDVQGLRHPAASCSGRRIRTVFAASAIDHDWLNPGQRYDRALYSTECLINLHNADDPALHLYPLRCLLSSRALGDKGFSRGDRRQLGGLAGRALDYDVSADLGHTHLWPAYYSNQRLAWLISNYVYFPDAVQLSTAAEPVQLQ